MKWNEYLAIVISVASVVSSGFYTYTYVNLQKTEFFNRIHSEYSTQDMQDAFDNLESFRDLHKDNYANKFIELKRLVRKNLADKKVASSTFKLGRQLDISRRKITHWYGKIVMFVELGYLRHENILMFPGKTRAKHALSLLIPITTKLAENSSPESTTEHEKIINGVKQLFGIIEDNKSNSKNKKTTGKNEL